MVIVLGAFVCARRGGRLPDPVLGFKRQLSGRQALTRLTYSNRFAVRGGARSRLSPAPFRPADLLRVGSEWYHLPTLLRLQRAGRLEQGSPTWRALEQAGHLGRRRLN